MDPMDWGMPGHLTEEEVEIFVSKKLLVPVAFCSRLCSFDSLCRDSVIWFGEVVSCYVSEYRMMRSSGEGERILLPLGGRVSLPLKITHNGEYRIVSHISHCALFM